MGADLLTKILCISSFDICTVAPYSTVLDSWAGALTCLCCGLVKPTAILLPPPFGCTIKRIIFRPK